MSTASTRTEKRAPVTLKIKFKSSTLDQFVERYSVDISQGGIFIRTKSPLEVGTPLRFEFQLKDATPLITGEGTVVWTREYDPSRTGLAPGMGVRFDRLPPESQQVLSKILEQKKSRPSSSSGRAAASEAADEFTDSPTRVAPRSVIAGLADTSRETFSDDDVPADAFEEATKVGLLDELVARTAEPDEDEPILTSAPRERAPSSQPIGVATDDESDEDEPELPAPVSFRETSRPRPIDDDEDPEPPEGFDDDVIDLPAPAARRDDFPDHIPTELNLAPPPPSKAPADLAATELDVEKPSEDDVAAAREKLGAPSETLHDSVPPLPERPPASTPLAATPHLLASEERSSRHEIEPSSGGGSGLWIAMAVGIILLAGGGGAWWMMTQQDDGPTAERPPRAAPAPAKQAAPEPPPEPEPTGLEATVASPVEGATATLIGGDQSGPVPMTFTGLAEGKAYKVEVSAPGFIPAEVELKGGETLEPVELEAKPRFIAVTSTPKGAAVYINKRRRGKTPFEIELKGALAKVDEYNVQLRRAGYDPVETTIAKGDSWSEESERMVASLDLTLNRRPVRVRPTSNDQTSDGGDKSGDTGKTDGGKTDGDKTTGSGDPVPDWAKDKKKPDDKKPDDAAEKKPPKEPAPTPKAEPAAPKPTP